MNKITPKKIFLGFFLCIKKSITTFVSFNLRYDIFFRKEKKLQQPLFILIIEGVFCFKTETLPGVKV